jgi:hypothetical protein
MIFFLFGLAALTHLMPGVLASTFGHSQAAWEYVWYGVEAAGLWAYLGGKIGSKGGLGLTLVCLWGYFESIQRSCRLAFPMNQPPPKLLPGQNLCDVAIGLPMTWFSLIAALFVACILQEVLKNE